MKRVWNFAVTMWRPALLLIAVASLLCILFGFRLGSLSGGMSQPEIDTYHASNSLGAIWDNPVNAPYKSVVYGLNIISNRASILRLASVGVGMVTVFFFYLIARRLFQPFIAIGATVLLATSTVFLETTRTLEVKSMLLGLVFLLWLAFAFRYHKQQHLAWILGSAGIGLMLYTPGIGFFIIGCLIWQQKRIRQSFERLQPVTIAIATTILFACLLPIAISLFIEPGLWRQYMGLPSQFAAPFDILKAILYVPVSVVALSPLDPIHWLGDQPILDVITSALFVYGLIAVLRRPKLDRLWTLIGVFVLGSVWIGVSGAHANIIILVPFVYLCIGFGIQALIAQWFDVFPRNPLARWVGAAIMGIAVLFSINFQLMRYFVAWAHAPETRSSHSLQVQK